MIARLQAGYCVHAVLVLVLALAPRAGAGTAFTWGNLLVASEETDLQSGMLHRYLSEFTEGGSLVRRVPLAYPGPEQGSYSTMDVAYLDDGSAAVLNGRGAPFVSVFSPVDSAWTHHTTTGWQLGGNAAVGGLCAQGRYVFAVNSLTGGLVRFDRLAFWSTSSSVGNYQLGDVSLGRDGLLYSIGSVRDSVYVFSPSTLVLVRRVHLGAACSSITADADGTMFGGGNDGTIYRFDAAGMIQGTLATSPNRIQDIDLNDAGRVFAGNRDGTLYITDRGLSFLETIVVSEQFPAYVGPIEAGQPTATTSVTWGHIKNLYRTR